LQEDQFLRDLQEHATTFTQAVATEQGEWIVKGFIDVYKRIYTISVDTKVVSKVLELLLFPELVKFAAAHAYRLELSHQQNFYPDVTFISEAGTKYAVDIKSTYRVDANRVNGMTLGAFTGYFRDRTSNKNTRFPYAEYTGHYVLGVIYSKGELHEQDERKTYTLDDLERIASVIKDFMFFAQPKWRFASALPGSGNTKNIGSVTLIDQLLNGAGPFATLGEEVYDDYWMFYLTKDMANRDQVVRPYMNLATYIEYKQRSPAITLEEAKRLDEQDSGIADRDESEGVSEE